MGKNYDVSHHVRLETEEGLLRISLPVGNVRELAKALAGLEDDDELRVSIRLPDGAHAGIAKANGEIGKYVYWSRA